MIHNYYRLQGKIRIYDDVAFKLYKYQLFTMPNKVLFLYN